jgi:hypothetical protein
MARAYACMMRARAPKVLMARARSRVYIHQPRAVGTRRTA